MPDHHWSLKVTILWEHKRLNWELSPKSLVIKTAPSKQQQQKKETKKPHQNQTGKKPADPDSSLKLVLYQDYT